MSGPPDDAERWLLAHRHGTSADTALRFLDGLPGVTVDAMTGRWHGAGWHTGHPWDGVLESLGWWGKEFLDADRVRPTLFRDARGDPRPVDPVAARPRLVDAAAGALRHPAAGAVFRLVRPLATSARPAGRLRLVEHRGTVTAALVYDSLPVIDAFRRVTDDLVLGAADVRGHDVPLLFVLRRAGRSPGATGTAAAASPASPPPAPDPPSPASPTSSAPSPRTPPSPDRSPTRPSPTPPPAVARFLLGGRVVVLPRRRSDRDRVLAWVAGRTLPLHEPVTERALTDRLAELGPDPVGLRRELVDAGLVTRTRDGAEYWRTRVTEFDPF